jgi:hypothetical protein
VSVTAREVHRIAEQLADVFRRTPSASHPWLWACFGSAVRERKQMDVFVADWAIALRKSEDGELSG